MHKDEALQVQIVLHIPRFCQILVSPIMILVDTLAILHTCFYTLEPRILALVCVSAPTALFPRCRSFYSIQIHVIKASEDTLPMAVIICKCD